MDKQYKDWNKLWKEMVKDTFLYEWIPSVDLIPEYFPTNYFQTQMFTNHGRFHTLSLNLAKQTIPHVHVENQQ